MRVRYFEDTDTALIELADAPPRETRELAEDLYVDFDADGHVVSITVEHVSRRGCMDQISLERIAARPSSAAAP